LSLPPRERKPGKRKGHISEKGKKAKRHIIGERERWRIFGPSIQGLAGERSST